MEGGWGGGGGNVGLGPSRSSQSYISKGEGEINKIKGWGVQLNSKKVYLAHLCMGSMTPSNLSKSIAKFHSH